MADEKAETLLEQRWTKGVRQLRSPLQHYWENLSFFLGYQWVYWSTSENSIRRLPQDSRRSRVTRNRIKRSVRVNLGKLLKNELQFDVSPDAADDAAVKGAQLATTLLEDVKDRRNWENVRSDEVLATMLGGTAAVCLEWDPAGYKQVGITPEKGRPMGEGEACLSALSIIEFVVQPGVKDAELASWWIKATAEDPQEAQARYRLDKAPEPDATMSLNSFEQRIIGDSGGDGGATRSYEGRVMVRTMFERPSRDLPEGRVQTVIAGKVVDETPWPFPFKDRLNFVVFRDMKVDGRWTGESMISDAVPVQTELNMSRSIIMEHLKKAGNARLWVPDTSVDEEDLTDDPGQPVFYNPVGGAHPEWSSPPPLPQWEINYPEQAAAEIDDILGVHDISRGDVPTGVESGTALTLLAERDDTPLGVFARDQAEGWGRIGTLVLKLYEKYLTAPRDIAVRPKQEIGTAPQRPYSVSLTGKKLHGQTKATVPLEVMAPMSRAVMQARADSLLQMGALGQPPDMRLYARIADLPDKGLLLAALSADADRAQRENEQMFSEQMAEPRDFDNHGVHISEHNVARKSDRYERSGPSIQNLFDLHIKAHETMAAEEAAQQEQKASESPNLAAAPQGNAPVGSAVPPAAGEMLAAQGAVPPQLAPPPGPADLAAMAPPPAGPPPSGG